MREKTKRKELYVVAFLLPIVVVSVIFALLKVYPFGEKTLVVWDANAQYVDFLVYFKKIITGEVSWKYTFSKTLGGDLSGFIGYYLLSPFNIVALFFEDGKMPLAFQLIYVLKMASCAVSCQYYWNHCKKGKNNGITAIFSATYALTAYNFMYGYNIMWLDAVIVLPLLAAGIEKIISNDQVGLYVGALMVGIVTCYYMGYILCLFSGLYFIVIWCFYERRNTRKLRLFLGASLFAAGLLAFILIPIALSMRGGKAAFSLTGLWMGQNYFFDIFFRQLATGSFRLSDIPNPGAPPLFCGMWILWMILCFFFSRKIERKRKAAYGIMLSLLLLSTWSKSLNLVWQGFSEPFGCAYRYSFLIGFLCICMAKQAYDARCDSKEGRTELKALAAAVTAIVIAFTAGKIKGQYVFADCLLLFCFYALSCISLWNWKKAIVLLIGILQLWDLGQNGKITWNVLIQDACFEMSDYERYIKELSPLTYDSSILCQKGYRMELDYSVRRSYNDAMIFDYDGISHYSSCEKQFLERLEERLGLSSWNEAELPDEFADDLLGMRYILSRKEEVKSYPCVNEENGVRVYENEDALPMVFGAWEEEAWDNVLEQRNVKELPQYVEPIGFLKERDDRICFSIVMEQEGQIRTTIPWDSGWEIRVDGKRIAKDKWLDAFLAFPVTAGEHEIALQYNIPGMKTGCLISAFVAVSGILWFARNHICAIIEKTKWNAGIKRRTN